MYLLIWYVLLFLFGLFAASVRTLTAWEGGHRDQRLWTVDYGWRLWTTYDWSKTEKKKKKKKKKKNVGRIETQGGALQHLNNHTYEVFTSKFETAYSHQPGQDCPTLPGFVGKKENQPR